MKLIQIYIKKQKNFSKSKRLQGVYVAQNLETTPSQFFQIIERVYEK
jgi:hypothetical protein